MSSLVAIFIGKFLFSSISGNNGNHCLTCSASLFSSEIFLRTVFDLNVKESMSLR